VPVNDVAAAGTVSNMLPDTEVLCICMTEFFSNLPLFGLALDGDFDTGAKYGALSLALLLLRLVELVGKSSGISSGGIA